VATLFYVAGDINRGTIWLVVAFTLWYGSEIRCEEEAGCTN
jgi:hypothetical protein